MGAENERRGGDDEAVMEYRVIVIGAPAVGKTSLINQLVHNYMTFEYDITIEDEFRKELRVDGQDCLLSIRDTCGQPTAGDRDAYMNEGEGFLCVYSLTNSDSLELLKCLGDKILQVKDEDFFPMVVVGNKSDLEDSRQVDEIRGRDLAKLYRAPFFETTALQRINVDEAFHDLVRTIRSHRTQGQQQPPRRKSGCFLS